MIKTVVFDFDGTLADTILLTLSAINELAEKEFHKRFTKQEYLQLRQLSIKEFLTREHIPLTKLPCYISKIKSMTREQEKQADLFPGIRQMLSTLSQRYTLGILTSNSEEIVEAVLKNHKINTISFISGGSPLFGKSHSIKKMLSSKKLRPEETVYVGDEVRDIQACRKAGIRVISVTRGYNSKKRLMQEKPDGIADTPRQLLSEIRRLS